MPKPTFFRDLAGLFLLAAIAMANDSQTPGLAPVLMGTGMGLGVCFVLFSFWKS